MSIAFFWRLEITRAGPVRLNRAGMAGKHSVARVVKNNKIPQTPAGRLFGCRTNSLPAAASPLSFSGGSSPPESRDVSFGKAQPHTQWPPQQTSSPIIIRRNEQQQPKKLDTGHYAQPMKSKRPWRCGTFEKIEKWGSSGKMNLYDDKNGIKCETAVNSLPHKT